MEVSRGHPTSLIGWGAAKCPPPLQFRLVLLLGNRFASSCPTRTQLVTPVKRRRWLVKNTLNLTPLTPTSCTSSTSGLRVSSTFTFRLGCGLAPQGHTAVEKVLKSSFWSPPLEESKEKRKSLLRAQHRSTSLGSIQHSEARESKYLCQLTRYRRVTHNLRHLPQREP